ncbi:MAG: tyrosine-protein phosphatase [Phycisphaerae bacterium]
MTARARRMAIGGVALAAALAVGVWLRADLWISGALTGAGAPTTAPGNESGNGNGHGAAPASRPANWAQPLTAAGLENFHRVSDGLYRGRQPKAEGFVSLKKLGVRTVVNLRTTHSDSKLLGDTGLVYKEIEFNPFSPSDSEVATFLKVVTDKSNQPVFVHCQHGADRTGMMCAMYRMAVEGWQRDEAIREMTQGGYGWHEQWVNILAYMNKVDVEKIKKQAGMGQ